MQTSASVRPAESTATADVHARPPINWPVVAVVLAAVALVGSMMLLQGQTNSRIEAVRTEVLNKVDDTEDELRGELRAVRDELLTEVRTLRESVDELTSPDLSGIQDDLAGIKSLLEQGAVGNPGG